MFWSPVDQEQNANLASDQQGQMQFEVQGSQRLARANIENVHGEKIARPLPGRQSNSKPGQRAVESAMCNNGADDISRLQINAITIHARRRVHFSHFTKMDGYTRSWIAWKNRSFDGV